MIQLYHGDCLVEMGNIPDHSVNMILCDLPYGTTACSWDNVIPFGPLWEHYWRVLKENGAVVLFGCEPFSSYLRMSQIKYFRYDWIWKKPPIGFLNCKKRPLIELENISVFSLRNGTYNPQGLVKCMKANKRGKQSISVGHDGGRLKEGEYTQEYTNYPRQVLEFHKENGLHPTQKPVALLEYLIKTYTNEGEVVLDNCMGSGSTGIACLNTGRAFIGIEKEEKYFEGAKERIVKAYESLNQATGEETADDSAT